MKEKEIYIRQLTSETILAVVMIISRQNVHRERKKRLL